MATDLPRKRFRLDDRSDPGVLGGRHSGRRWVAAGACALVLAWGGLYLAFRDFRARHRALAEYGRSAVATTVDPLAKLRPPGVDPAEWPRAVADTHAMLVAVTASGLLDRPRMEALRDELKRRVGQATPDTALETLRGIWDDMEARAGPILTRRGERPPHPPERPALISDPHAEQAEIDAQAEPR
jgi:hypothetical protein